MNPVPLNAAQMLYALEEMFPKKRLDSLFRGFDEWRKTAYDQSQKNIEDKTGLGSLLGKIMEESWEVMDDFERYAVSSDRIKYARKVFEEIYDVANMGLINMPLPYQGQTSQEFPDLRQMLVSLAFHYPRYETVFLTPFNLSEISDIPENLRSTIEPETSDDVAVKRAFETPLISRPRYTYKELFEIWAKEVKGFGLQQSVKYVENQKRRLGLLGIFVNTFKMIHRDAQELTELNFLENYLPYVDMRTKWVRLMGDAITYPLLLLNEVDEYTLEDFFEQATEKMKQRDKRYHGLRRLDEKLEVK